MTKSKRKICSDEENEKILADKYDELESLIDENSKFIYTTNKKHKMLVDLDCDFNKSFKVRMRGGYIEVSTIFREDNKRKSASVGRVLLGLKNPKLNVDHKNRNPLDNRKCNLRICNQSENLGNRKNYSAINKYKGYQTSGNKIRVECQKDGLRTSYTLNTENQEYAAIVYDCLAVTNHGDFAETNFNIKNYTKKYIDSILTPILHLKQTLDKYEIRTARDSSLNRIDFNKLDELGFVDEVGFKSYPIGANVELLVNRHLEYSIRLDRNEGGDRSIWNKLEYVSELKTLIKLLSGQNLKLNLATA